LLRKLSDSQGEYEQALPLYQEALKITEQVLGKQHPNTALSIWWLATYYEKMQDYEQALPLYQAALDIYINTLGEQHPHTKTLRGNYEGCLRRKGLSQQEQG
jgi:tetratricopeptide (TPR) repeat protein